MIKNILILALIAGVFAFWTKSLKAQFGGIETDAIDKPVVVELFTSQSCSSCPPADKNLAALSENPNIIALSFHVTYWNHLHWKDTLSQQFSTDRQRSYAAYKRNGRVYTPQMIVNGGTEFVGSRGGDITNALQNATSVEPIRVVKDSPATLTITLPEIKKDNYTLWIAGTNSSHTQSIPSGENRGRTVTYKNAVTELHIGGKWDGTAETRTLDINPDDTIENYVILAQKDRYGAINAAGKTE